VDVVDSAGRSVYGARPAVRWAPNMGETGRTGGLSFPWIGRITEDDNEIPRVFAHYEDQVVEFRTPWDAGMRLFLGEMLDYGGPLPILAHDTVTLVPFIGEASNLRLPVGLPVILFDDEGWVDSTGQAFEDVGWPVAGGRWAVGGGRPDGDADPHPVPHRDRLPGMRRIHVRGGAAPGGRRRPRASRPPAASLTGRGVHGGSADRKASRGRSSDRPGSITRKDADEQRREDAEKTFRSPRPRRVSRVLRGDASRRRESWRFPPSSIDWHPGPGCRSGGIAFPFLSPSAPIRPRTPPWRSPMHTPRVLPLRIAPLAMILAFAACSGDAGVRTPTDALPAEAKGPRGQVVVLVPHAGNGQSGQVGTVLADSLAVELRTTSGEPVPNAVVTWAVAAGGGSVSAGAPRTDARGRVRAAWTLGSAAGPAQVKAVWHGDTVVFAATQTPPMPSITVVQGQGQTATGGTMVETRVRVTNAQGAPIVGAAVESVVLGGGGFLPWGSDWTSTDGDGFASPLWVLGLQPGENRMAVRVDGIQDAVITATGVDAPLTLGVDWPGTLVSLSPVRGYMSWGVMTDVEGIVTDPAGNRVWGVPVRFTPNNGEAGAEVLTGTGTGEGFTTANFFWEGWMGDFDDVLPELVLSYAGQTVHIHTRWDAGERTYQPVPWFYGSEPYAAGTTLRFDAFVEEVFGRAVPRGLPVFLSDGTGWSVETVAGAVVDWPLGAGAGTRTLTFCVISPSHTCQDFPVQVQHPAAPGASAPSSSGRGGVRADASPRGRIRPAAGGRTGVGQEALQHLDLHLLQAHQLRPVRVAQGVQLFAQRADLHLRGEVDLVVVGGVHPVAGRVPVLRHHDHGRLQGRQAGEQQVEQDVGIRIERLPARAQDLRVQEHPPQEQGQEEQDEGPRAPEPGDGVRRTLAERALLHERLAHVAGNGGAPQHRLYQAPLPRGQVVPLAAKAGVRLGLAAHGFQGGAGEGCAVRTARTE
jgi:hypothetical protein